MGEGVLRAAPRQVPPIRQPETHPPVGPRGAGAEEKDAGGGRSRVQLHTRWGGGRTVIGAGGTDSAAVPSYG